MTIDITKKWLKGIKEKYIHGGDDDYDEKRKQAIDKAIASLEAWEKVRQEIEDLEKSYGFDKATKYGNKDGKQMDLSYSTMYMYEIAGMVDEIKEIIDKHLQEVAK